MPVPGQRAQQVLGEPAAPVHGPGGAAVRAPGRRCARPASGRRAARPRAAGRARRPRARGGTPPAGSPASCAATRPASAGSRRGSTAQTTTSASSSPAAVRDRRPPGRRAATRSVAAVPGQHGRPCGSPAGRRAPSPTAAMPPGDRPGAEPLLDVRRHAGPGGHVAQVVALGDERVAGDHPQPLVLERPAQPLVQHLAAVEARGELAGQVRRGPRAPRGSRGAAPPSRRRTTRRGRPTRRPSPGSSASNAASCAAREPPGTADRRAVLEAVLADHVERDQLQLALDRPAGLAEQVADHRRAAAWTSARRPR